MFHGSIAYITFVFVGVALDPFVGGPILVRGLRSALPDRPLPAG